MRKFSFPLRVNPENYFARAQKAAGRYNVDLRGEPGAGHFVGQGFEGNYEIQERTLHLTVVKKPFFLTWQMIESMLQDLFSLADSQEENHSATV
ncbi:MAG TPA: hypothetical protein PKN04_04230 [bacterium]|nr:hypothetical protein [bacterium]HNT64966.1 hypothetical protein [bacterium]